MSLKENQQHLPYNPALIPRAKEMRKNMTAAEKKLWSEYLRTFPLRVYRQRPIDHYIVDFYCPKLKLVIEVDGETHFTSEAQEYDQMRSDVLRGYGLEIIRFTNNDVLNNLPAVCDKIEKYLAF